MEQMPLDWFFEVPLVTRIWTCSIALSSILEQCNLVSKLQLMYNYRKVFEQHEYWRLITTFFYFGELNINLIFYVFFVARYSRMLEESFYQNRSKEYMWILFLSGALLIVIASFTSNLSFLGPYLSSCLIYLWARRNPQVQLSLLGLFTFSAPYLPWVMTVFSAGTNKTSNVKGQLVGIGIGHVVFFFEDVYPNLCGRRPLSPPWEWF